jgi:replication factor C subunit 3/5
MSDYEDEMDVDLQSKDAIQFGSDNQNAKGKRIAADLPIEVGDNLPWYSPSVT